jgi:hypothetical protein
METASPVPTAGNRAIVGAGVERSFGGGLSAKFGERQVDDRSK